MLRRGLRRFLAERRGTVNLEFVLWLPLIVAWMVAITGAYDAWRDRSETARIAHAVSDLLTRELAVDDARLAGLHAMEGALRRRGETPMLRVASVRFDGRTYHVDWTWSSDPDAPLEPLALPLGLMPAIPAGGSLVYTEVSATHRPLIGRLAGLDWTFRLFARPRYRQAIEHAAAPVPVAVPEEDLPQRLLPRPGLMPHGIGMAIGGAPA
ncbi:MAG: hypothetical protein AAFZ09_08185 [Pseudomonadota bacterium]